MRPHFKRDAVGVTADDWILFEIMKKIDYCWVNYRRVDTVDAVKVTANSYLTSGVSLLGVITTEISTCFCPYISSLHTPISLSLSLT